MEPSIFLEAMLRWAKLGTGLGQIHFDSIFSPVQRFHYVHWDSMLALEGPHRSLQWRDWVLFPPSHVFQIKSLVYIMLRNAPSIPTLLSVFFYHKFVLYLIKCFSWIYWYDHVVFIFAFVYHTYIFFRSSHGSFFDFQMVGSRFLSLSLAEAKVQVVHLWFDYQPVSHSRQTTRTEKSSIYNIEKQRKFSVKGQNRLI